MKHTLWPLGACGGALAAALIGALCLIAMESAIGASAAPRESRAVAPFDRIALDAPGELLITQGSSESLVIEAEAHVLSLLRTRVDNGTLVIGLAGSVQTHLPIRYHLGLRTLTWLRADGGADVRIGALHAPTLALQLAGSSTARVADLTADRIDIQLEGSGELTVQRGQVRRQQVRIDDAASYEAAGLHSDEARIEVHGSGQAHVHAGRVLDAQLSDSARLRYSGAPRLTQRVSGAAELLHASQ